MEEVAARRAAEALFNEHKAATPFKSFDASVGLKSMPDAYDIQDQYVALLRAAHGDAVGYKVGLTSKTKDRSATVLMPRELDAPRQ